MESGPVRASFRTGTGSLPVSSVGQRHPGPTLILEGGKTDPSSWWGGSRSPCRRTSEIEDTVAALFGYCNLSRILKSKRDIKSL